MFEKLIGFFKKVTKDVGLEQVGDNTENQVYETVRDTRYEYFAVIETVSSSGYNGIITELPADRGTVKGCKSTTEVLEKLTQMLNDEFELCKKLNRPFPTPNTEKYVKDKYWTSKYSVVSIYPKNLT